MLGSSMHAYSFSISRSIGHLGRTSLKPNGIGHLHSIFRFFSFSPSFFRSLDFRPLKILGFAPTELTSWFRRPCWSSHLSTKRNWLLASEAAIWDPLARFSISDFHLISKTSSNYRGGKGKQYHPPFFNNGIPNFLHKTISIINTVWYYPFEQRAKENSFYLFFVL